MGIRCRAEPRKAIAIAAIRRVMRAENVKNERRAVRTLLLSPNVIARGGGGLIAFKSRLYIRSSLIRFNRLL